MESMRRKDQETVVEVEIYGKEFKGTRHEWNNGLYERYAQWVRVNQSRDEKTMEKYLSGSLGHS